MVEKQRLIDVNLAFPLSVKRCLFKVQHLPDTTLTRHMTEKSKYELVYRNLTTRAVDRSVVTAQAMEIGS